MSTENKRLEIIGKQIQGLRKNKGYSQTKLSVLLGITREHLSKVERGVTYPSLKLLFDICDTLGVKSSDLIVF